MGQGEGNGVQTGIEGHCCAVHLGQASCYQRGKPGPNDLRVVGLRVQAKPGRADAAGFRVLELKQVRDFGDTSPAKCQRQSAGSS